jgi:hypothetical protein
LTLAFGVAEGGWPEELMEEALLDDRSDSSLLSISRSSFDSYFLTGFGIEGRASQFTHVVVVSALIAPLKKTS